MKKYLLLLTLAFFATVLKAQTTPADTSDKQVYVAVQGPPSYPGGDDAFTKFIKKNLQYPAADRQNNIQGRVYVNFIIEKDGSITHVKILRTPSQTIADEALRLMLIMPKWNPGTQSGHLVRVSYTIPVNFSL